MEGNPIPPPAYASYPRFGDVQMYGTSEKLSRLYRGYCGTLLTFLCGFLGYIAMLVAMGLISSPGYETFGYVLFVLPVAGFIGTFFFSVRSAMDIGYGNNWSPALGAILGVVTPFMCLIMCAIMGFLASSEMKKYGITYRSFRGLDKKLVKDTIAKLAEMERSSQPIASAPI